MDAQGSAMWGEVRGGMSAAAGPTFGPHPELPHPEEPPRRSLRAKQTGEGGFAARGGVSKGGGGKGEGPPSSTPDRHQNFHHHSLGPAPALDCGLYGRVSNPPLRRPYVRAHQFTQQHMTPRREAQWASLVD